MLAVFVFTSSPLLQVADLPASQVATCASSSEIVNYLCSGGYASETRWVPVSPLAKKIP